MGGGRIIVADIDIPERLDIFLSEELQLTRSYIKQLIENGFITVDGQKVKSGKAVKNGSQIYVEIPEAEAAQIVPQDIPLDILYEDDDIAVINKQQGLTVHPGGGAIDGTLVNALMFRLKSLSTINGVIRPGIVHRLDKDTSGVMVVAKNDKSHLSLAEQIAARTVDKIYLAVTENVFKEDEGTVNAKIGRNSTDRKLMAITNSGRDAVSQYKVLERFKENTFVQFKILTGRTHQIRIHSKYIGHPLVGDKAYGFKKQKFNLNGQLLHAHSLTFVHPSTKERLTFIAPLPEHFERVLKVLRQQAY